MWWAIGGGIVGLLVIVFVILLVYSGRQVRQWEERIKSEGDLLLCWIADAPESLREASNAPGYAEARVVFSPAELPNLQKRLKEASERLMEGKIVDETIDPDLIQPFYDKIKEQRWLHAPLRLPKWLVGDIKAYTAIVPVYWRQLPKNKLTLPYVYCRVLMGEKGGAVMVKYPAAK